MKTIEYAQLVGLAALAFIEDWWSKLRGYTIMFFSKPVYPTGGFHHE